MSKRVKKVKAWAGVVDNRIDLRSGPSMKFFYGETSGVFRTRAQAKKHYSHVIPVEIIPTTKKKQ